MRISFKLSLDMSKSQIKALKRQGIIVGLDQDDPPGRVLVKRVLAQILDQGLQAIFAAAPFPVTTDPEGDYEDLESVGYSGPPGSAPVEDEPPQAPAPKHRRRPRPDNAESQAS